MKLAKPFYMIKDVNLDLILPTCKIGNLKFRAYYETKRGAEEALKIVEEIINRECIPPVILKVVKITEVIDDETI